MRSEELDLTPGTIAFYDDLGSSAYRANRPTVGPWSPGLQHGGPPAALLAREVEVRHGRPGMRLARLAFDFHGPVPVGELTVETTMVRPGQRIQLSNASLRAGDRTVMTLGAWHLAAEPGRSPPVTDGTPVPPLPQQATGEFFEGIEPFPYAEALEWRFAAGGYRALGPATVWTRTRVPLLRGEEISPLARLLVMVDAANGISAVLPIREWTFVPVDLSVVLERHPVGVWVGMAAGTSIGSEGIGITEARLFDAGGWIGRATQTLFIARRQEAR